MTSFTGIRIVIILHFKRLKTILGIVHTLHLIQLLTLIEDELFCLWMVPSQQVTILSLDRLGGGLFTETGEC